eukprot:TRINITY_DN3726_c0_g1_i2.p1 TRINITY_DN3726_c0_g1~~TRINITY_DN3726_c0_g1_i2.p1  ORF type:complete len:374 (+),score=63.58 TRINITY_DN3726_c0_g1_i2:33-1154(+)
MYPPNTCKCDPNYDLLDECGSCDGYSGFVIVAFSLLLLYVFVVIFHSWRQTKNLYGFKGFVLSILVTICLIRIIRYAIIISLDNYIEPKPPLLIFLQVTYSVPFVLAFIAWTLMIYFWIKMYRFFNNPDINVNNMKIWDWRPLIVYTIICVLVIIGWVAVIFVQTVRNINIVFNAYTGAVLLVLDVFFFVSGILFNRQLKSGKSFSEENLRRYVRMNRFVIICSAFFLLSVVVLIIITIVNFFIGASLDWFVGRSIVYRIVELIPLFLMANLYGPSPAQLRYGYTDSVRHSFKKRASASGSICVSELEVTAGVLTMSDMKKSQKHMNTEADQEADEEDICSLESSQADSSSRKSSSSTESSPEEKSEENQNQP